jgi:hypothetical protein
MHHFLMILIFLFQIHQHLKESLCKGSIPEITSGELLGPGSLEENMPVVVADGSVDQEESACITDFTDDESCFENYEEEMKKKMDLEEIQAFQKGYADMINKMLTTLFIPMSALGK